MNGRRLVGNSPRLNPEPAQGAIGGALDSHDLIEGGSAGICESEGAGLFGDDLHFGCGDDRGLPRDVGRIAERFGEGSRQVGDAPPARRLEVMRCERAIGFFRALSRRRGQESPRPRVGGVSEGAGLGCFVMLSRILRQCEIDNTENADKPLFCFNLSALLLFDCVPVSLIYFEDV